MAASAQQCRDSARLCISKQDLQRSVGSQGGWLCLAMHLYALVGASLQASAVVQALAVPHIAKTGSQL